ncbi:hypothetical protein AMECASPLE_019154 [Ameca splendens]|uniref:Uncharacterized protein n=1 Tax=Ameca splendens TaxID=208324 RepID=A0ABV0ZYM5_9TELE
MHKTLNTAPAHQVLPQSTGLERAKMAASLGDSAVADEDTGLIATALTSAGWETTAPDVTAAAMGDSSSPAEKQEGAPRQRFLGRKMPALLADQGTQPGEQAENGAEPPQTPSAPAAVETAKPPDQPADVSSPPPSAAEPSDPWHSPAYRTRGPCLAETFCQV